MFIFQEFDHMVLVTAREQRNGYGDPIGTIHYTSDGKQRSIHPGEPNYAYIEACYVGWKKRQADQARKLRDQEALSKLLAQREHGKQGNKLFTIDLPGLPPVLARIDDFTLPLQSLYWAEASERDIIAYANLEPYSYRYGCYSIHGRFEKVAPSGTMGRKQIERARLLRDRLVAVVKAQLIEAGWRIADDEPGEHWRWEGERAIELEKLATRTWLGRARRDGKEKVIDLPDSFVLLTCVRVTQWRPVPKNVQLEYLVDLDAQQLRVRRRHIAPQKQEQQRAAATLKLGIIGDPEAHARGTSPAYHRTIHTRPVTFRCQVCKEMVTQERLPGPIPQFCSDPCRDEARREKTLERVRRLREQRKMERLVSKETQRLS